MAIRDVYAEISKGMASLLDHGTEAYEFEFDLPSGVTHTRKQGSRACLFTCDDNESFDELSDLLDESFINWQISSQENTDEDRKDEDHKKYKKRPYKTSWHV